LLFVGLNGEWDTEGQDRPHMDLPSRQNELIERVAAVNPRTVVVLQTGGPVTMPWLDRVGAVLEAWYPGQECGNAIADVLFGKADPGGRLPQTFPVRLEDNPAFANYPGANGRVRYEEGIFVGYRHYEGQEIRPLFPFGHGLSYTRFSYDNLRLSPASLTPGGSLSVALDVTNTGERRGQEVLQVYLRDQQASVPRPEKELKAFAKVALEPGETRTVTWRSACGRSPSSTSREPPGSRSPAHSRSWLAHHPRTSAPAPRSGSKRNGVSRSTRRSWTPRRNDGGRR
jgi:beta-glucosidase